MYIFNTKLLMKEFAREEEVKNNPKNCLIEKNIKS
jgi:hypothetical protein